MITEDYVSFETAKLLKEKGFDEPCALTEFDCDAYKKWVETTPRPITLDAESTKPFCYPVPSIYVAMKWLREVHNIHIGDNITYTENPEKFPPKYYVYVSNTKTGDSLIEKECGLARKNLTPKSFDSPEEACEAAIKYCLENLI